MPTPFDTLTLADIQQRLQHITPLWLRTNRAFYDGDHWQHGAGWVGPMLPMGDPNAPAMFFEIQKAFVSENAVGESTDRHRDGVIGREPDWGLTVRRPLKPGKKPTQAEQALIDEAEALLTSWWDERGLLKLFQAAVVSLLLGERACLRLFIPAAQLINGHIPPGDLPSILQRLYVEHPAIDAATVITDAATQQQCSVYCYIVENQRYVELSYLDGPETVIRILGPAGTQEARLALGGKLLMYEMTRKVLISETVRQNQKQLNLAKTMLGRNVIQGGFLERIFLNAQPPGEWVSDTSTPDGKRFVPRPLQAGAGRTNFVSGQPIRDTSGKITGYANASVVFRDPVKVDTFVATEENAERSILKETHQLHTLIAGDATSSGESRKQARADFAKSLLITKTEVDRMGRWLLETTLALASLGSGQPGRYASLRATFACWIDTGPLSSDEEQQIINQVERELLSPETAMARLGVEDVDAEQVRIDAAREKRLAHAEALAAAQTPPHVPSEQGSIAKSQGDAS